MIFYPHLSFLEDFLLFALYSIEGEFEYLELSLCAVSPVSSPSAVKSISYSPGCVPS
jgi:hypothetical protein